MLVLEYFTSQILPIRASSLDCLQLCCLVSLFPAEMNLIQVASANLQPSPHLQLAEWPQSLSEGLGVQVYSLAACVWLQGNQTLLILGAEKTP